MDTKIPMKARVIVKAKDYEAFLRLHKPTLTEDVLQEQLKKVRDRYKDKATFTRMAELNVGVGPYQKGLAVWPQTIKKSEDEEIDMDKPSRETIKRFLVKMIQQRKEKKVLAIPVGKANAISVKGDQLHKMLKADPMVSERSKGMIHHKYPVGDEYKVYKTAKSVMVEKLPDAWEAEMNRLERGMASDIRAALDERPEVLEKWTKLLKGTK